jgi:membrane protease YdiL (CAAX protease family)
MSRYFQRQILLLIGFEAGIGLIGLIWMFFSNVSTPADLLPGATVFFEILGGLVLAGLLAGLILLLIKLFPDLGRLLPQEALAFLRRLKIQHSLLISLAAGFGEELLFRGALQPSFGVIIASILFGIAHPVSYLYVLIVTGMGFVFGYAYELSGSLYLVITAHAFYDFIMIEIVRRSAWYAELSKPEYLLVEHPEVYPEN